MEEKVPKEVLKELDIGETEKIDFKKEVTAIVEVHQIKLPVPKKIRMEINIKKGKKVEVNYDPKTKQITYQL